MFSLQFMLIAGIAIVFLATLFAISLLSIYPFDTSYDMLALVLMLSLGF